MQYKLGTPYEQFLFSRVKTEPSPAVTAEEGTSGYWGQPVADLDPRLIDAVTGSVREDVRETLLSVLYAFWEQRYNDPREWSTVWMAGSALSHQYAEHTTPDLDILIGVDFNKFFAHNKQFAGSSETAVTERFNDEFRNILDPEAMNLIDNFEVTFYVNPRATDIRSINPYSAFNLSEDTWTVSPVDVPQDWNPREYFPKEWWSAIDTEVDEANTLVSQYSTLADRVRNAPLASLQQTSSLAQLRAVAKRATSFWSDIHDKRKIAFSPNGSGYYDYFNLRWQAHKKAGTVKALHSIAALNKEAEQHAETTLYGAPIDSATQTLLRAQLWNQTYGSPSWYRKRLHK